MMKELYKNYLFTKNILVNDGIKYDNLGNTFSALFTIANKFNIRVVKGKELATLDVIKYISKQIPDKVTEAFYRGFPESVRKLTREELLFDQLLHYFDTYVCGNFEGEAAHSLFEENFEREAFTEKTTIKNFDILTEEDAMKVLLEMANNLLQSSRPLSVGA